MAINKTIPRLLSYNQLLSMLSKLRTRLSAYLPLTGGTVTGPTTFKGASDPLKVHRPTADGGAYVKFENESGMLGLLGVGGSGSSTGEGQPFFQGSNGKSYKVWTNGNQGVGSGMNADTVDGWEAADLYMGKKTEIDASALDPDTWYPVTIQLSRDYPTRIRVGGVTRADAPWNNREDRAMGHNIDWISIGSSYGWIPVNRIVLSANPGAGANGNNTVRGIGQMTNTSVEYVYVRGGAKYNFYVSTGATPILRTETFTSSTQSISPTTECPPVIEPTYIKATERVKFFSPTQLTDEDLNGISTSGEEKWYWANSSNTCANRPTGVTMFNLRVLLVSAYKVQVLIDQAGNVWKRRQDGSTWGAWQRMATTADIPDISTLATKAEVQQECDSIREQAMEFTVEQTSVLATKTELEDVAKEVQQVIIRCEQVPLEGWENCLPSWGSNISNRYDDNDLAFLHLKKWAYPEDFEGCTGILAQVSPDLLSNVIFQFADGYARPIQISRLDESYEYPSLLCTFLNRLGELITFKVDYTTRNNGSYEISIDRYDGLELASMASAISDAPADSAAEVPVASSDQTDDEPK